MNPIKRISWLSPKVEVCKTLPYGKGAFALEPIKQSELISLQGGHIITLSELLTLPPFFRDYCYQISDDILLSATSNDGVTNEECINHSCNPNSGFQSEIRIVAMRDICVGEQITIDYAMCLTENFGDMECFCGSSQCRGRFTGNDWMIPELQIRYRGYFQPYIEEKLRKQQSKCE